MKCCNNDCEQGKLCPQRKTASDIQGLTNHENDMDISWADALLFAVVVALVATFGLVITGYI